MYKIPTNLKQLASKVARAIEFPGIHPMYMETLW